MAGHRDSCSTLSRQIHRQLAPASASRQWGALGLFRVSVPSKEAGVVLGRKE